MSLPKRIPPLVAVLLSLVALATVLFIDNVTELSVALLYLLPVGIASWFLERKSASAISLLTALGWFLVFYRNHLYHGWAPAVWDTFIALVVLLTFSHILRKLKAARDRLEMSADLLETQARERTSELDVDVTERKHSEKKLLDLNEALQRRTEQLRSLSFELTRAEEQERHRIARLLHDDLQQLLVAAKFSLRTQSSQRADDSSLDNVCALLDQSIAASRSLTAELVPPMLYEKGLSEALRWLAGCSRNMGLR